MTRFERNRKRKTIRRAVLVLFLIIVPLTAVAASMFMMNILNSGSNEGISMKPAASDNVTAFKHAFEIGNKTLYRLELKDTESFGEAEAYIKKVKAKKLNGFIVKENGYKVIYGVFSVREEAEKVQQSIAAKVPASISEIKLQGYNLKYNEEDSSFIQLVQATDKLIWDVAGAKALLSQEIVLKPKKDMGTVLEEISKGEAKLEKYLGYAKEIKVTSEQKAFREDFVMLLEDVLAHRLENEKDYYKIQDSILNQLEAYRKFIVKLSI